MKIFLNANEKVNKVNRAGIRWKMSTGKENLYFGNYLELSLQIKREKRSNESGFVGFLVDGVNVLVAVWNGFDIGL